VNYIPMPDSLEIVITKASASNGWFNVVEIWFVEYYLCNIQLSDIRVYLRYKDLDKWIGYKIQVWIKISS
jgi:hypothetical protein